MASAAPQSGDPEELRPDELEIVEEGALAQPPAKLHAVPQGGSAPTEAEQKAFREFARRKPQQPEETEVEKAHKKLGVKQYSPEEFKTEVAPYVGKPEEGTVFTGREPQTQLPPDFFEAQKGGMDLDVAELQRKYREGVRKAVQVAAEKALEGPVRLSREQAGTQTGAEILHRAFQLPQFRGGSSAVETLSGPMAVMSGLRKPHAMLMSFAGNKVFAETSPGPKPANAKEYEPNSVGVIVKPDNRKKSIQVVIAQGLGEGPYVRDDASALANAAIVEAGALLLTGDKIPAPTMIHLMNKNINEEKKRRGIREQDIPLLAAELDATKGLLRVGSAGDIRCIIINPQSGSAISSELKSSGKTGVTEYQVPQDFVVLFATDNFVQAFQGTGSTPEKSLGQFFRKEMRKGASADQVCASLIKNHHNMQAGHKASASSFGLVGLVVPKMAKGPLFAKEIVRGPKKRKERLELEGFSS